MSNATPMMKQYRAIKNKYRDTILFFRLGDFYEMFERDAQEASFLLDLTLTQRNKIPMCGIPYHAAPNYIARLIKAGKKIAICEQTQINKTGKGIARREVTEVITPGTVIDENLLDRTANNYLVCIGKYNSTISFSYIDLSTSDFYATHFSCKESRERLKMEFLRLAPSEVLIQESLLEEDKYIKNLLDERESAVINRYPDWSFNLETARTRLENQFNVANLKGFGLKHDSPEIITAGVILDYISETAKSILLHIRNLTVYSDKSYVGLDESTQKNLEIVQNLNDRSKRYTLLEVLDQTKTAMGSRKLKRWLLQPLKDVDLINDRLDHVNFFYINQIVLSRIRDYLGKFYDLERLSSRIAMEKAHAKDLLAIKMSLFQVFSITELLESYKEMKKVQVITRNYDLIREISDLLEKSILEEPSILLSEGNLIKRGYNQELDTLHDLKENARSVLKQYLEEEQKSTGISSLKLKYNRIIGHFLEVTKSNLHKVPEYYIRRQTLVNGERFTTEILANKESEINNASEKIVELERKLFLEIRRMILKHIGVLLEISDFISEIDVLQAFSFSTTVHGYVRPEIKNGGDIKIIDGRHPVVEAHLSGGTFVPNSLHLSKNRTFILLTGPNMAGKSTYLRQTALIVLMAQIGSFVPAAEARIGIVDNIFCRVGAMDNLARGESTFLVEMNETANILRSSTENSLIIMDEVGRGTSTNDGLSIAWAVIEFILARVKAKTLFATHFHELTTLKHQNLTNLSMAVLEREGEIIFLKQVKDGPVDNSYGIHVARIAGIPEEIIRKAEGILSKLEKKNVDIEVEEITEAAQPLLFTQIEIVRNEIQGFNISETTPLNALNRIAEWKKNLLKES